MIEVESHTYTSAVVRRLRNFSSITNVYEIAGAYDISAFIKVDTMYEMNNLIEELRTIPGVKTTDTRMVLKKYNGNGA